MSNRTVLAVLCLALAAARPLPAADGDKSVEPPLLGRPDGVPFSEASGQFRVSARAEPAVVRVEEPVTLRVRVTAVGPVYRPPQRIDLASSAAFAAAFDVEEVEVRQPSLEPEWELVYRLRPRRTSVNAVPSVPLAFYDPDVPFPERGFQVAYAEPIPLQVLPPRVFRAEKPPLPEAAYVVRGLAEVLAGRGAWSPPGPALAALALLLAPLLCLGWYRAWRHFWPDAAGAARQRRSRAAAEALRALQRAQRLAGGERAARAAAAVALYLRRRLDLPAAEPTPAEASGWLEARGCPAALAERAAGFFRSCDAARFAPGPSGGVDLAAASALILAVEEESCLAASG
jgi:hypothetical protein